MRSVNVKNIVFGRYSKLKRNTIKTLYRDKDSTIENAILLASSGRSGSTWLADLIEKSTSKRIIFEPFLPNTLDDDYQRFLFSEYDHPDNEGISKEFRLFISENSNNALLRDSIEGVLKGKLPRCSWRDRRNSRIHYAGRVIKDIRMNLFLKYIQANFPQLNIIFLIRHPCAVVASQYFLGWEDGIELILQQRELMDTYLRPFSDTINSCNSRIERLALRWCIENYIPLEQFSNSDWTFLTYERLCTDDEQEWSILFNNLQTNLHNFQLTNRYKPGMTKKQGIKLRDRRKLVSSWKNKLKPPNVDQILKVVASFGLDSIYSEDSYCLVRPNL